jgi:hypothetical protein
MQTRGRSFLKKALIVLAILIAVLLILPWFIHVDSYRPQIISEIQSLTGWRVEMGQLSIRFLPKLSVVVQNFALKNPPGFPSGNFITAVQISANLKIWPLLHRQVVIDSIEIQKPVILLLSMGGDWNFETPARRSIRKASASTVPFQATASEIVLTGARIMLAHVSRMGQLSPPSLDAEDAVIDLKTVRLGPRIEPAAAPQIGMEGARFLRMVNLEGGRPVQSSAPSQFTAHGSLHAKSLRFRQVILTHLKSGLNLEPGLLSWSPIAFDAYNGKGAGSFQADLTRPDAPYKISLKLTGVDVAKLLAAFPGGSGKLTGTLNATSQFSGDFAGREDPWAGKQADGQLMILRGKIPNLKLSGNILQMMRIAGVGPASGDISSFSSITADFKLRGGILSSRSITLVGNGLEAAGQGSADLNRSPDPGLNYQGVAHIRAASTPLTNALSSLVQIPIHNGMLDLPFRVGGTLNQPKFTVQPPGGLAGNWGGANPSQTPPNNPNNLIQGILGLFGNNPPSKRHP